MAKKSQHKYIWIEGNSCCGKTTRLIELVSQWIEKIIPETKKNKSSLPKKPLILSANTEGKKQLLDKILVSNKKLPFAIEIKTPFGFMIDEVELFYPLIVQTLKIPPQIPIRLRPETEQELASQLWRDDLTTEILGLFNGEAVVVRKMLDLLQLAGSSGVAPEEIPARLKVDKIFAVNDDPHVTETIGKLLLEWREYCLNKGLLSYGIIYELYWRYLLTNPVYQGHLLRRYGAVFADDVDDYPAVSGDLFKFLMEQNLYSVFTYNNQGKVRLGLNADPDYLRSLSSECKQEFYQDSPVNNLAVKVGEQIKGLMEDIYDVSEIPEQISAIKTFARSELIQATVDTIINGVKKGDIKPEEIAIIAPGLDEIARFNLIYLLQDANIPIEPLKEQRPLISSPLVRGVLTVLGLLYQGNGRLIERDMVAEMLVVLSLKFGTVGASQWQIDPVRAGVLADYCYHIDIESPCLLPIEYYPSGDRMNYKTFVAYNEIRDWIETTKLQIKRENLTPLAVIDKILPRFFPYLSLLTYTQVTNLREMRETASHIQRVSERLDSYQPSPKSAREWVADFIVLLRKGTITANPYPTNLLGKEDKNQGITLATIYQYRTSHLRHRWQFWLDAGSNLWGKGGAAQLVASSLFLRGWDGQPTTPEDEIKLEKERVDRVIFDLLSRTTEKVFLCHSELDVNGNQQMGSLIGLIYCSEPMNAEDLVR